MKLKELGDEWEAIQEVEGDGGNIYKIYFDPHAKLFMCSCPGWGSSRSVPKACKHLRRHWFKKELEVFVLGLEQRGFMSFQSQGSMDSFIRMTVALLRERGLL